MILEKLEKPECLGLLLGFQEPTQTSFSFHKVKDEFKNKYISTWIFTSHINTFFVNSLLIQYNYYDFIVIIIIIK